VLTVKRRGLGRVEVASNCVVWIVEPQTDMKRVRRRQSHIGVKAEDLIQKDGFDADVTVIGMLAGRNVTLIPRQTEALTVGIQFAARLKDGALKGRARVEVPV